MLQLLLAVICIVLLLPVSPSSLAASETCENLDQTRCTGHLGLHFDVSSYLLEGNHSKNLERTGRLAIMILHAYDDIDMTRIQSLDCTLRSIVANLALTPKDIYLWSFEDFPLNLLHPDVLPHIQLMKIRKDSWCIPAGLSDASKWAWKSHFTVNYYTMGQWRLIFGPDFARSANAVLLLCPIADKYFVLTSALSRSMGYRYYLQIDLDAQVVEYVPINLVQHIDEHGFLMGGSMETVFDYVEVLDGLAELTKFWLQIRKFNPVTTVLRHIETRQLRDLDSYSWDREIVPGYFYFIDLSFWFSEDVQDFLTTVLRSGRDIEGRWQEQGVQNMVRHVFVLDSLFLRISGVRQHVGTCH